ncbi:MAG TPA: tRNA lysidine(34) synthetase TilS [Dokdonella sp.]|uniref:tRNA lysidine(34) synthetase TilS n=1 Tax=Dokdonella sp. TaxID=2291710 RepID=UPI002C15065E|nr:tRNA lysidine(34) synthetase TilS [Dokdonella sp.]HUD41739.1 tRNA lysidine(34) synthetase TilS [Dokdonella sp.]
MAYSGGLDSSTLLHALAGMEAARARGLSALHVDHGLQADSRAWSEHCQRFARSLDVSIRRITIEVGPGAGPEGAARRARYGAIETVLAPGEILALAHHRDDQAETVLLKLMRGSGPEGLGAMRTLRPLGLGHAWRPLLDLPQATLRDYASLHDLPWVQDPSNFDMTIDRNLVRAQILPRLRERWPEADASLVMASAWARAASDFIDVAAEQALASLQGLDPATLRYRGWLDLPEALRDPSLRRWLRGLGLSEPTHFQTAELMRQLAEAGDDRQPCVRWPGAELRRHRDLLYASAPLQSPPLDWMARLDAGDVVLPADLGVLRLVSAGDGTPLIEPPFPLYVRFRHGGETIRLSGSEHRRELSQLFQESGLPPWERGRVPLVIAQDGTLLAVADLWTGEEGQALFARLGCRVQWAGRSGTAG